jgi:hypothetical protein
MRVRLGTEVRPSLSLNSYRHVPRNSPQLNPRPSDSFLSLSVIPYLFLFRKCSRLAERASFLEPLQLTYAATTLHVLHLCLKKITVELPHRSTTYQKHHRDNFRNMLLYLRLISLVLVVRHSRSRLQHI